MSGAVGKEVTEALWLTELFVRIDRMAHAIAQYGQILVDIAGDEDADDPDARAGAYWIMRTCHEVSDLRERLGDQTAIESESLRVVETLRDGQESLADRGSLARQALTLAWRNGFKLGAAFKARHHEREFSDGGGI